MTILCSKRLAFILIGHIYYYFRVTWPTCPCFNVDLQTEKWKNEFQKTKIGPLFDFGFFVFRFWIQNQKRENGCFFTVSLFLVWNDKRKKGGLSLFCFLFQTKKQTIKTYTDRFPVLAQKSEKHLEKHRKTQFSPVGGATSVRFDSLFSSLKRNKQKRENGSFISFLVQRQKN